MYIKQPVCTTVSGRLLRLCVLVGLLIINCFVAALVFQLIDHRAEVLALKHKLHTEQQHNKVYLTALLRALNPGIHSYTIHLDSESYLVTCKGMKWRQFADKQNKGLLK